MWAAAVGEWWSWIREVAVGGLLWAAAGGGWLGGSWELNTATQDVA
jgi:hypothetical protein